MSLSKWSFILSLVTLTINSIIDELSSESLFDSSSSLSYCWVTSSTSLRIFWSVSCCSLSCFSLVSIASVACSLSISNLIFISAIAFASLPVALASASCLACCTSKRSNSPCCFDNSNLCFSTSASAFIASISKSFFCFWLSSNSICSARILCFADSTSSCPWFLWICCCALFFDSERKVVKVV